MEAPFLHMLVLISCILSMELLGACRIPGSNQPCRKSFKKRPKPSKNSQKIDKSALREELVKERVRRELGSPASDGVRNRLPEGILNALWKETQENSLAEKLVSSTEIKKMIIHATKSKSSIVF